MTERVFAGLDTRSPRVLRHGPGPTQGWQVQCADQRGRPALQTVITEVTTEVLQAFADAWIGKELSGPTASGAKATMRLESDGKASVSAGNTSDTGTWRLSEGGNQHLPEWDP